MQSTSPRSPLPVRDSAEALYVLSLAIARPLQHETLAFLLDTGGIGGSITVVSGTERPEAVLDVVNLMAQVGGRVPTLCALVVASVRPGAGLLPGDIDRWLEASSIAELHGIRLAEWYIIGPHGVECPRDLLGEPERWVR